MSRPKKVRAVTGQVTPAAPSSRGNASLNGRWRSLTSRGEEQSSAWRLKRSNRSSRATSIMLARLDGDHAGDVEVRHLARGAQCQRAGAAQLAELHLALEAAIALDEAAIHQQAAALE